MNKFNNVIFDFDGTLANTSTGVKESVKFALDSLAVPHSAIDDSVIGPSPLYLYSKIFALDSQIAERAALLHRKYSEEEAYKTAEMYKGVPECLAQLKKQGINLFIVSLKKETVIKKILSINKLDHFFTRIIGVGFDETMSKTDLLRVLKNSINFKKALYVGDTQQDFECCKSVGLDFCFANYGFGHITEDCSYRIDFIYELLQLV